MDCASLLQKWFCSSSTCLFATWPYPAQPVAEVMGGLKLVSAYAWEQEVTVSCYAADR